MIKDRKKIHIGTVASTKMKNTVVVSVSKINPHPLYKKLIKKDKKVKADIGKLKPKVSDLVKIVETRPLSKDKHFRIVEVVKK